MTVERWAKLGRAVDAAYLSHKSWQAKDDLEASPIERWIDERLGDVGDDVFKLIYVVAGVPYPSGGGGDGGPDPPAAEV